MFLVLLFSLLIWRLTKLQLLDGDRYVSVGESQRTTLVSIPAERGSVFDRNGFDLALSVPQNTVWADPRLVGDPYATAGTLGPVLDVDAGTLVERLTRDPGAAFVYLARQVDDDTAAEVERLDLDGVAQYDESRRFLPAGDLGRGVLGDVDIDNHGISGLEQQYDHLLTGRPGQLVYERDPSGRTIAAGEHQLSPAQRGDDLVLTIDQSLQFQTEQALAQQIMDVGAQGGMAVVSNPRTGEVYAMVNLERDERGGPPVPTANNRSLTTVFEPGSANKVITMAASLEEGKRSPGSTVVVPDSIRVADTDFRDHDPHPTERMSLTTIMATSSNVGTIMLAQELGGEKVDQYLRAFGFGRKTALDFPNESPGLMLPLDEWSGTSNATIPIGQGVAVTAQQMLQAFNVIANGGVYTAPTLVSATVDAGGQRHPSAPVESHRVVSAATAGAVRDMMVAVVEDGTGKEAAISGYTVAGKTGTARKPQPGGGYTDEDGQYHYVAAFAGFVPAEDPQLSAIVVIDEPTTTIFASDAAAPVFREVIAYGLRRFAIPPSSVALDPAVPPPAPVAAGDAVRNEVPGGRSQPTPAAPSTGSAPGTAGATTTSGR